jgi:hypothetical protein
MMMEAVERKLNYRLKMIERQWIIIYPLDNSYNKNFHRDNFRVFRVIEQQSFNFIALRFSENYSQVVLFTN